MQTGLLSYAVKNGEFVVTTECKPPRGCDSIPLKEFGNALGSSVHAIVASESEDGARICSLAACAHLASAGAEPILALLTRDLNRIALQTTILGAASMGITNILCLSGRHQALTSEPSARGVFDIDAIQLLMMADGIRRGQFAHDQEIDNYGKLILGVETNPFAEPLELQIVVLEKAVSAGADFVITQPVFNLTRFDQWMGLLRDRGIDSKTCLIASVMPITAPHEAIAMAEKLRFLDLPREIVERIDSSADERKAGIDVTVETITRLRDIEGVRGVHIMTGGDFQLAKEILQAAGLSRS